MIEIQYIPALIEQSDYYLFAGSAPREQAEGEDLAVIQLKVAEDDREFAKLLEVALEYLLLESHELRVLFQEGSPGYKRKLRSYVGLFYWAKKEIGAPYFIEREFDLPDNRSVFTGLMNVDPSVLPFFLQHLLVSSFTFGLFFDKAREKRIENADLLTRFFQEAVSLEKERHIRIDWLRAILLLCREADLIFRLAYDGQDNQYLEFYGRRERIESGILQFLLPRLKEHFYIRGERSGIVNS